jgi:hypothetical protein
LQPSPGHSFLQYRLIDKLGEGGMGVVWRAEDTSLERQVAIKLLPGFNDDGDRLARFEREAKAVAALSHPNILAIHDFGTHEGQAYAVMELLEGDSLRERLAAGALPPRKAVEYATQIAKGLAAAHERGVVHRDLKPDNVFVTRDGIVKILDFGLAKVDENIEGDQTATPTRTHLTEPGSVLGTVGYMSPEQVRSQPADHRADIFSFGAVLYEMLTGRRPFDRETAAETMTAILREDPPHPEGVDPTAARVALHCLEKRPEERFQSARDLVFALGTATSGSQPGVALPAAAVAPSSSETSATLRWGLIVAALVAGLALGTLLASRLGGSTDSGETEDLPSFQRLTFARGEIHAARFIRDGGTIVYSAKWRGNAPDLYSITRGSAESLPLGFEGAVLLAVSAQNELAILRDTRLEAGDLVGTLARVPLGGAAPRDVDEDIIDADWTGGGDELAVLRNRYYRHFVESPSGNVLLETPRFARLLRASPTGPEIAATFKAELSARVDQIVLIDPSGSQRTLTECACTGIAFHPSGREIWFSDLLPSGETALGAVSLEGERREIYRTAGRASLKDIAPDGRVLISYGESRRGILGFTPYSDEERDLSWLDGSVAADLSEDGRWLLFNEVGPGGGETGSFFLRDLSRDLPAVRLGSGRALALSPDGAFVLAYEQDVRGEYKVVPTGAGTTRRIDLGDIRSVWGWLLPDGNVLFNGRTSDSDWRFYVVSPDGGTPQPVSPEGVDNFRGQIPYSPDGRWVAGYVNSPEGNRARIYDVETGDSRDLGTDIED